MYRIGRVSLADKDNRQVKVRFEGEGITSGMLRVIKNPPKDVDDEDAWFPEVGDVVACLYNDEFNGDGIVIGGL